MKKPSLVICSIFIFALLALPFMMVNAADSQDNKLLEPGILPNSFWYNFEIIKERIIILFTFSNQSKADKLLSFSGERLSELNRLVETHDDMTYIRKCINRYISTLDELKSKLDDCNKDSDRTKEQLEKSTQTAARQIEKLNEIKQKTSQELSDDLSRAIDKTNEIKNISCQ